MSPPLLRPPFGGLRRLLFRLRPEEAIAAVFLLPTTWLTLVAHLSAPDSGVIGPRFAGGVLRIGVALLCAGVLTVAARRRPAPGSALLVLREMLPFLLCILIYTNLHDTIGFVNPRDIHQQLLDLDLWLFGVEPTLWAEQFYSRERTEFFQILYMSFTVIAPAVPLLLLLQKRSKDFRRASLSIILCFYLGYFLYLIFPSAPPRVALAHQFTKNLGGDPLPPGTLGPAWPWEEMGTGSQPRGVGEPQDAADLVALASESTLSLLPTDSRAAFPSLHAAVSLLALGLAWRFTRWLFYPMAVVVFGLWASTIYLRHHFVVDLLAGFLLAPVAYFLAPRLDAWWLAQRAAGPLPRPG